MIVLALAVSCVTGWSGVHAQDCYPGPGQVALYLHDGFLGECTILDAGLYADPDAMGFKNDNASSLRVGHNATVILYQHRDFKGKHENFTYNDSSLSDNYIGNDTVSSVQVLAGSPDCNPGPGEVALFQHGNYSGYCTVLGSGLYSDQLEMNFPNDRLSSLLVGENTAVITYQHSDFKGKHETFTYNDISLSDNYVGNDTVSSIRVLAGSPDCNPGPGEVALFQHGNYSGYCTVLKSGLYFDPQAMNFPNDRLSSVKLGAGAVAMLFPHGEFDGAREVLWGSDPDLTDNPVGNDTVSSIKIVAADTNCYPASDQIAVFVHDGYQGHCQTLDYGVYRHPQHIGLPNDSISSIRVGSDAMAWLYPHDEFDGSVDSFRFDDPSLSNNVIGNDSVSSILVGPKSNFNQWVRNWADTVVDEPTHKSVAMTQIGRRQDVVVVLYDPVRPAYPRPSKSDIYNALVGLEDSLNGYYHENSGGLFSINLVGIYGWYTAPLEKQGNFYWNYSDPDDSDEDGFTSGHTMRFYDAVHALDADFDFTRYNKNNSKAISWDELTVVVLMPGPSHGQAHVPPFENQKEKIRIYVDKEKNVELQLWSILDLHPGSPNIEVGLFAHEINHEALRLGDMYFANWYPGIGGKSFYYPYAAESFSIMDNCSEPYHLDPVTKLKLGWIVPQMISRSGTYNLTDVETTNRVWVLLDPNHGYDEYFILENRWPGSSYDVALPDEGLAIWHVIEDPDINKNLEKPDGTPQTDWNDFNIAGKNWERRVIRLIRAGEPNPPVYPNDSDALWDTSSGSVELQWHDETPSGIIVRTIEDGSLASPMITIDVTLPE